MMKHVKTSGAVALSGLLMASFAVAGVVQTASFAVQTVPITQHTASELQQLVAPIALYPDALVAQILAASTYPIEVVQANRWMQEHVDLKGENFAQEVDRQPWDPSVRALTQFPTILANMDKNLTWTCALGDAYLSQPQAVLDAVQVMRQRARAAGNLQNTPQETVTTQGQTIIIQPADPEIIYVPTYDPWVIYGAPLVVYPGWYPYNGLYVRTPGVSFSVGFGVSHFSGVGWGWRHWGADWRRNTVVYNHNTYITHGSGFSPRNNGYNGFAPNRVPPNVRNDGKGPGGNIPRGNFASGNRPGENRPGGTYLPGYNGPNFTQGNRPGTPGNRPTTPDSRPNMPGNRPSVPGNPPGTPGSVPNMTGSRPGTFVSPPSTLGNRPNMSGSRPGTPNNRPSMPSNIPSTLNSRPSTNGGFNRGGTSPGYSAPGNAGVRGMRPGGNAPGGSSMGGGRGGSPSGGSSPSSNNRPTGGGGGGTHSGGNHR